MKTEHFYQASAIRQQSRQGYSVAQLATAFSESEIVVEKILGCRTREAAAKVLDERNTYDVVRRFVLVEGSMVDFSNLIQWGTKHK